MDKEEIQNKLNSLCKPTGSLGVLETIALDLCRIQQTLSPATSPRHITIFAADHGVVCEGVSAWPSEVTAAVVKVMQTERTASGVFAKSLGCTYEVVDAGLMTPISQGTENLLREPAMTALELDRAWDIGKQHATVAHDSGNVLLIGGEMGIGNTTAASCLIGLLTEVNPQDIVGRGAGIDDATLIQKQQVVTTAIERVQSLGTLSAKEITCQVGGFEIVSLAGFYVEGARRGKTLLIDGLIATAAALIAEAMHPGTRDFMIAGHRSTEPGHAAALKHMQLEPILDLKMRLGEATGALSALPLLDLASSMMNMATLDELELT
ncbi:MAG: nicotinate-nucleotide--dimethylbenzimidazole phosphoribosyltransferase [Pirellulales bacterium]